MSEKRKPEYTILLRKRGNTKARKVELFPASYWIDKPMQYRGKVRIRVDGKWWPKDEFRLVTITAAKELLFKAIQSGKG
jgi:hypothetical protein